MKNFKKTLLGSLLTLLIGTSCCWVSGVTMWDSGLGVFAISNKFIESFQMQLLLGTVILAAFSGFLYWQQKKKVS